MVRPDDLRPFTPAVWKSCKPGIMLLCCLTGTFPCLILPHPLKPGLSLHCCLHLKVFGPSFIVGGSSDSVSAKCGLFLLHTVTISVFCASITHFLGASWHRQGDLAKDRLIYPQAKESHVISCAMCILKIHPQTSNNPQLLALLLGHDLWEYVIELCLG